jgi:hypothetical protein
VQAGLIPKLRRGEVSGFHNSTIITLRPSDEGLPQKALVQAFRRVSVGGSEDDFWGQIQDYLQQQENRTVLYIDQFEELFALFPSDAKDFTQRLHSILQVCLKLTLIISIRSEFYGFLQDSALGDLLEVGQVNVQGMSEAELKAVIRKPAERVGLRVEEGLENRIVADLQDTRNPLPLLEFTLLQLWQAEHENNLLTSECYLSEGIGGVTGAIAQWANHTYNALNEAEQTLVRRIFTRLIHYSTTDTPNTRRPLSIIELVSRPEANVTVRQVVKKLADARLLVTKRDTVEIIHDALITQWTELDKWIKQEGVFLLWRQRLDESLKEWKIQKEQEGYLLNDAPLAEAEGYLQGRRDELNAEECRYIEGSLRKRDRDRRRTILGLTGGLVVLSIVAVIATWQWQRADLQSQINKAESLGLSALRQFESGGEELEALLTAMQAGQQLRNLVRNGQDYPAAEPLHALQKIVYNIREAKQLRGHQNTINTIRFSPDGQYLATAADDGTVRLWDLKGNRKAIFRGHQGRVGGVRFGLDGKLLVTVGEDGVRLWNLSDGRHLEQINSNQVSLSPDGKLLAVAGKDGTVSLQDLATRRKLSEFRGKQVSLSPDGKRLATIEDDGTVQLWDLSGNLLTKFKPRSGGIGSLSFSPDGKHLATTARDSNTAMLRDLTGKLLAEFKGHEGFVSHLRFSPDGKRVVTTAYGTVRLWNLSG